MSRLDLSTTYLGIPLAHPIMPGASPLADDLDMVRRLEDAGAPAIVLRSLFEEQIERDQAATHSAREEPAESFAEALSYLPGPDEFSFGPQEYLEQVRRVKRAVGVPVIASLNGATYGGWLSYARMIEEAGADALELNVYELETDVTESSADVERRTLEVVQAVCDSVQIPVAVKLSPFYTALAAFARRVVEEGARGLVLFNRFYQPDIDLEELEVRDTLHLSESPELLLRLRWLAILGGRVEASLAASGGAHDPLDVLKAIHCGADVVQMVSALLRHGPQVLREVRAGVERWMEEHEVDALSDIRGSMSLARCPDPKSFERANYMRVLASWRAPL